jgi:hypothetical protein
MKTPKPDKVLTRVGLFTPKRDQVPISLKSSLKAVVMFVNEVL